MILNWNGLSMLQRFLPTVLAHSSDAEVVVADNGSTDGSADWLASQDNIRLIRLDQNYGFAEGYNRALAQVQADYYVLLNSDVECTPHWIEPVVEMMETNPQVAVAAPKLLMYDDKSRFEYAGAAGGYIDRFGYPLCRGRLFGTLEQDLGQYNDERDIFWATGACMFVRSTVWHQAGGLDSSFFAHMEEIDFCWRVAQLGYRVRYCPQSHVYHVGGGTLPKSSPLKTQLNFRNNLCMLRKNLPPHERRIILPIRLLLDHIAALKFLLEGHVGEYRAVLKAHKQYHARKHQIDATRTNNTSATVGGILQSPLLIEYYLLKHTTFSSLHGKITRSQSF